jgi:hypothetical protein
MYEEHHKKSYPYPSILKKIVKVGFGQKNVCFSLFRDLPSKSCG